MVKLRAIDFFCGGGGMTCGLRQAGVEVMAGVDLAEECESTYEANNPGTKFVGADITKLEENYFEKQFGHQIIISSVLSGMMIIWCWSGAVPANIIRLLIQAVISR